MSKNRWREEEKKVEKKRREKRREAELEMGPARAQLKAGLENRPLSYYVYSVFLWISPSFVFVILN